MKKKGIEIIEGVEISATQLETLAYIDNYLEIKGGNLDMERMSKAFRISKGCLDYRLKVLHKKGLIYYNRNSKPMRGITRLGKKVIEHQ